MSRRGFLLAPDFTSDVPTPVFFEYGAYEWKILVTGRLVAADDSALWTIRDAIQGSLDAKGLGTLVDQFGRSWPEMFFSRLTYGEETDRGRDVSLSYLAEFHKFTGTA
jgi:hypothetical protein